MLTEKIEKTTEVAAARQSVQRCKCTSSVVSVSIQQASSLAVLETLTNVVAWLAKSRHCQVHECEKVEDGCEDLQWIHSSVSQHFLWILFEVSLCGLVLCPPHRMRIESVLWVVANFACGPGIVCFCNVVTSPEVLSVGL